jgi:hypothetical protein
MQNTQTEINWKSDSFNVIRAKNQLIDFLEEQKKLKGKFERVDAYHIRRISELQMIINQGA